jgi:peroxiredoxin
MVNAVRSGYVSRVLEIAANLATLFVAGLLSLVLLKTYPVSAPVARPVVPVRSTAAATVGTNLNRRLAGVNWNGNGRTLILVLSTHCHFCTESAPFFRHIRESAGKDVKLVGVLPQPVAESESYLTKEGLQLDEVRQGSLENVGVEGTPTMLLVDRNGIVRQTWVGKLSPDKQDEALKAIAHSS